MKKAAFTLAEVLITLAIIGVVAAMTIPTLIAKINSIVTDNQVKVFNAKLIKGLNLTKTAGDLNDTYTSTYDFLVNGLGKNLKMAKVCDSSHIRDCIPYDKIKYEDKNGNEKTINVADLKTAEDLQIKNTDGKTRFTDTAAFVLADGTPVIVTYDLNCIDEPDKADTTINSCLAGIYDLNGTRKPNKYGETEVDGKTTHNSDLQPFNGARIANAPLAVLGGVRIISNAQTPAPIAKTECEQLKASGYPINNCIYNYDYWVGAVKTCKDLGGHLPTEQQLANMANALYGGTSGGGHFSASDRLDMGINSAGTIGSGEPIPTVLTGIGSSWCYLWSSSEGSSGNVYGRAFNNHSSSKGGSLLSDRSGGAAGCGIIKTLCVSN